MIRVELEPKVSNLVVLQHVNHPINNIINFMVKYNVISVDIYDIFNGRKNNRKFVISFLNCVCLWLTTLLAISIILFDGILNYFDNPIIPFDKFKQMILLIISCFILVSSFKTDFILQEKQNNLIRIKFLYYLIINDKSEYKLNKYNYERYKNVVNLTYFILIKFGHPIILSFLVITLLVIILLSKLTILIILLPLILYSTFTFATSGLSMAALNICLLMYYYLRLKQINIRMKLYNKISTSSSGIFIRLINEHNDISSAIYNVNMVFRRSLAAYNFLTCCILDFLLYLIIYTNPIYYKFVFLFSFVSLFVVFAFAGLLLVRLTNTAHQSYGFIYSLFKRKLTYKIRFKVLNND